MVAQCFLNAFFNGFSICLQCLFSCVISDNLACIEIVSSSFCPAPAALLRFFNAHGVKTYRSFFNGFQLLFERFSEVFPVVAQCFLNAFFNGFSICLQCLFSCVISDNLACIENVSSYFCLAPAALLRFFNAHGVKTHSSFFNGFELLFEEFSKVFQWLPNAF